MVRVTITTTPSSAEATHKLVSTLTNMGVDVTRVNVVMGVISGRCPHLVVPSLDAVSGVTSVISETSLWGRAQLPK